MNKDAYYFPHFTNARSDRKIKRIIKDLGVEGYGMYFMLLEVLREQTDFQFPLTDIDLLADEFNVSEAKLNAVINSYNLFEINKENNFFSPKLIEYLQPYLKMKNQRIEAGKRSAEVRRLKAMEEDIERPFNESSTDIERPFNENDTTVQQSKVKKSKLTKENNKNIYVDFFNFCWNEYPRKEGKGSISDKKKKELHELGDEFKRAIQRYKDKIAKENIPEQYIKMGSSFFNTGYIDYLDSNFQPPKTPKPLHRVGIKEDDSILIRREDY